MDKLIRFNRHFQPGFMYEESKKREFYDFLLKKIDNNLMLGIFGLRRVGKTTCMQYLINYLISKKKVDREKIIYFSFDDASYSLWDIVALYEKFSGKKADSSNYFFFDEIQKVPNWIIELKEIYDTIKPKIFISGSESAVIKKTTESLAGRIFEMHVSPLSFREFLDFKGMGNLIGKKIDFTELFEEYLFKQFPEVVNFTIEEAKEYSNSIARKIIYEDIPKIFNVREPELMFMIFKLISSKPGMIIDIQSLSNEFGVSRNTLSQYFEYLEKSYLIKKIYNYSKNKLTSEKKLKKYYTFPTLHYLSDEIPFLVEAYIATQQNIDFFWRDPQKNEVDFINAEPLICFEVKYRENIHKKDLSGLNKFNSKFSGKQMLIAKHGSKLHFKEKIRVICPWDIENVLKNNWKMG